MKQVHYLLLIAALTFAACSKDNTKADNGLAGTSAKQYYQLLQKGNIDAFLQGIYLPEKQPKAYKDLMLQSLKDYYKDKSTYLKSITHIDVSHIEYSKTDSTANVFLDITYKNTPSQRILLPMVKDKGVWKMR